MDEYRWIKWTTSNPNDGPFEWVVGVRDLKEYPDVNTAHWDVPGSDVGVENEESSLSNGRVFWWVKIELGPVVERPASCV